MFNPSPPRCRQFRQARVLVVGCGDVGLRAAALMRSHVRLLALTSSADRCAALRQAGVQPLLGNLDQAATLGRLSGLASRVLHLAPPPGQGREDPRTRHLLQALALRGGARQLVYASTTGVYGHAQGQWLQEWAPVLPATERAHRRVHAEALVRWWGRRGLSRVTTLRIPGIYAWDREGGDPRERVRRGSPVLLPDDDVFTNHIHADDLARACVLALWRGPNMRTVHVVDDQSIRMGDYFDQVADLFGLPRPPRLSLAQARTMLSPMQLSFMGESRRLHNDRLKHELRLALRYPTVQHAHQALKAQGSSA